MSNFNIMQSFGGRMRINQFLGKIGDGEIGVNFRKDGRIVRFDESDPVLIKPQDGYEFSLSGMVGDKMLQTRAYPVIHRKNSAWCQVEDLGLVDDIQSTVDGVPVDIQDPVCKRLGTRDEVFKGQARMTTGGLHKKDLVRVGDGVISLKEKKRLDNMQKRLDVPSVIRARDDTEYKFGDIAEGLSLVDLYALAQDDLDGEQTATVRRFIGYRIASLLSDCMGFERLREDGRPLNPTDRERREFNSIQDAIIKEIPRLVYGGMDQVDATEAAIWKYCVL